MIFWRYPLASDAGFKRPAPRRRSDLMIAKIPSHFSPSLCPGAASHQLPPFTISLSWERHHPWWIHTELLNAALETADVTLMDVAPGTIKKIKKICSYREFRSSLGVEGAQHLPEGCLTHCRTWKSSYRAFTSHRLSLHTVFLKDLKIFWSQTHYFSSNGRC